MRPKWNASIENMY